MKLAIVSLIGFSLAAQTARAPMPSYKTLKYPALKEVKIPDVTSFTLRNGIKIHLLENHELPVVSGFALVRTGNLFEKHDKAGLAGITGSVMRTGGTKSKSGEELNEQLENIAASVESNIGETNGRVSFNCLKENTDEVLAAFKDVLTDPEFRQDKLDLAKTQEKSSIARRNDDPGDIARREFADTIYGKNNPYGWSIEYSTIDNITRDDLFNWHQRYFFPKNTMLAIYGDFSIPEMRTKLEKIFADWIVEQPPVPEFPKLDAKPQPGVYLASKDDVNQTSFRIGHLAGTLRDKDYPALEVMASVLGGSPFTSRLGSAIRVQRGYAYQIGADWAANYNHPGLFLIVGGTKSENTVPAIKTIQDEVKKFLAAEPTEAELKSAKDKILNTFVFNFDNPSKTLSRLVTYEYYGYPKDFIFDYQKAIEAVTRADVLRVAKQYLKPDDFTYVVVGKPAEFKTALTALNMPVNNIDLTIPDPKKQVAEATSESMNKGEALLSKMVESLGGADKIATIKDITQSVEMTVNSGSGPMKVKRTQLFIVPSTFRQENEFPFGKMTNFFDGKSGWMKTPQGDMPLAGPILRQVQEAAFRNLIGLAQNAKTPGRTINAVGDTILEISDKAGYSTRIIIDEKTGLPLRQIYTGIAASGPPQEIEEVYDSFAETNGVKLPSSITILQGGKQFAQNTVTETKINSGLKTEDLAKKP